MPVEYIPPSIPTLCNLLSTMFHFGVAYLHPTRGNQHDLPSIAPPKGERTSSFSWTSHFKNPTPRTLRLGDTTLSRITQIISVSIFATVFCATKSAIRPLTTKTWACMYLQKEPSTPPSDKQSGDTDEATNLDNFTQVNAHHTYRFQCNHEFTGIDVVAYLGKRSSNHYPGPMEETKAADKPISFYDPGGLPFLVIPKAKFTMQGTQVPYSPTSTFYPGSKLSELLDYIFAGYLFLSH